MLSVATSSLSALPSTIRDSFSRNTSDSEQSKEGTTNPPQNTFRDKIDLGNTKLDEASVNSSLPTPPLSFSTPKEEKQPKIDVDAEPSTTWQENLAGTAEPTTDVDNTPVVFKPSLTLSDSGSSLKIEHFVKPDDDDFISTPIAGDISSQIPPAQNTVNDQSDSNNNDSRKSFRLTSKPNSKLKKKNRQGASESIIDDSTLAESPPVGGYAPAAPRKNAEFHSLFRSVPEDDYLINDYGCALQKEILVQGRLYVSAKHVCFYANIFGWVTILVIAFSDILSIEKKMTAFVIPNAVLISTLHAKHFFTSFLSRDPAFELMYTMWKQTHPALALTESENSTSRKDSDASETSENNNSITSDDEEKIRSSSRNQSRHTASNTVKRRRPTQCACLKKGQHYDNVSLDTKLNGSVEKIFNLLFVSDLVKNYIIEEDKCTDIEFEEWKIEDNIWTRSQSYTKPLNNPIGPKSTKCFIKDECSHFDDYITNVSTATTPDVPSGNNFCVKTRTCIMCAGTNESRIIVTCAIEWSKSSWLKGAIEKACIEGQRAHWQNISQVARKYIAAHLSDFIDQLGTTVQDDEANDSEVASEKATPLRRTHTRTRTSPSAEELDSRETEPVTLQQHVIEILNIMTSVITSLIQIITIPSKNIIIILILFMLVVSNFNNWLTLRDIGHRLDGLDSSQYRFGYSGRSGDFLYEPRKRHGNMPLFDERIENEDDTLWNWLQERSNMYEEIDRKESSFYTSKSEPISSKVHSTSPRDSSSSSQPRPISSQGLYEQMENLRQLIQTAEEHAKKLVDVAEFESAHYYKGSKDKRNGQHYEMNNQS